MAWTGSICDMPAARKAAGSILTGQDILSVASSALSSVSAAQTAAAVAEAAKSVCDRVYASNCSRAYQVAYNLGGTFSSSYSTLYASLPDTTGHHRQMICGG